jgi:hypothetical protein
MTNPLREQTKLISTVGPIKKVNLVEDEETSMCQRMGAATDQGIQGFRSRKQKGLWPEGIEHPPFRRFDRKGKPDRGQWSHQAVV